MLTLTRDRALTDILIVKNFFLWIIVRFPDNLNETLFNNKIFHDILQPFECETEDIMKQIFFV